MISVVVNTCNEEKYLEECLKHLQWADEIVVIDMHSTDRSVEIAKKYTDKIFFHERTISVLYARNFSLTKAQGDWILIIDPDEIVPAALAEKLRQISRENSDFAAVSFPMQMFFLGKKLNYVYPVIWKERFFKKNCADFPARVHGKPAIKGGTYTLPKEEGYIVLHYVADSIYRYVEKMNRYTSDEAVHMFCDDGVRFSMWKLIEKPLAEFKNCFFVRRGYKDGRQGFIFSVLMAIYRFLTYAKLWELEKR